MPRVPCPSQQCKRGKLDGAPLPEALFVLSVLTAIHRRLIGGRDLIIDSVPILAWRRAEPDAAFGHAPAQHPRPLLRGYRVYTLICRGSDWFCCKNSRKRGSVVMYHLVFRSGRRSKQMGNECGLSCDVSFLYAIHLP
jgi:hypothetical protein